MSNKSAKAYSCLEEDAIVAKWDMNLLKRKARGKGVRVYVFQRMHGEIMDPLSFCKL